MEDEAGTEQAGSPWALGAGGSGCSHWEVLPRAGSSPLRAVAEGAQVTPWGSVGSPWAGAGGLCRVRAWAP